LPVAGCVGSEQRITVLSPAVIAIDRVRAIAVMAIFPQAG
jgi:hypothetical protein